MLRDHFGLPLADKDDNKPATSGPDRTHLLALWVGSSARKWHWAVEQLLDRVQDRAQRHYKAHRRPELIKLLAANLDPLSHLCGFDPDNADDTWYARPTSTLRFAEILAKIAASDFDVGELFFLFTAERHIDGGDPFPLQDPNEALDSPLGLPDSDPPHSLWALREKLRAVEICEEQAEHWTWRRIAAALREDFGYAPLSGQDPLLSLGQHFFPHVLESQGQPVSAQQRQYRVGLSGSTAAVWNRGPFEYDAGPPSELWTQLPLTDEAVIEKPRVTLIWRREDSVTEANTPLLAAIVAAFIAGIANIIVAWFNQKAQRRLEREKAEATRILEMIKTGGVEKAKTNLQFLAESGLITDEVWRHKIVDYIKKHPEDIPVLPGPGDRFKMDASNTLRFFADGAAKKWPLRGSLKQATARV